MKFSQLNIDYYNNNAKIEAHNQLSKTFNDIHHWWYKSVTEKKRILDIGCGIGRDCAFLHNQNHEITGVEPSEIMCEMAKEHHPTLADNILVDKLPDLSENEYGKFDIIICSSVFHLIPSESHLDSLIRIKSLLSNNGFVVLSLRHAPKEDNICNYPTEYTSLLKLVDIANLKLEKYKPTHHPNTKNQIFWSNFILS